MPAWFAAPLLAAGLNAAGGLLSGKTQYKWNKKLADHQYGQNREFAEWQHQKELELRKWQLGYDSPEEQMKRLKAAGLNPNMVYGSGTQASGSFGPPMKYPDVAPYQMAGVQAPDWGSIGTQFQQARLMDAQTDLTKVKTDESSVKQDLMKAQKALTDANPYLKPGYVDSMVLNLKSVAQLKEQESSFMLSKTVPGLEMEGRWERGYLKMQRELDLLQQKFNLGTADQQVKARIIESKEFENALKKVQADWMKDGDITPQHIYQGIFMLLQSLMR